MSAFSSASFKYYNNDIETEYFGGDVLKGYINISFDSEPSDYLFRSNLGNDSIELLKLLYNNGYSEGDEFECSNTNCENSFESTSEVNSFSLSEGDEKYIGIRVNGKNAELTDVSFKIDSNSAPSCSRIFEVEILENYSISSSGFKDVICGGKESGCFDSTLSDYDMATIGRNPYCQKMTLGQAPAFRIGAKIKNSTVQSKLTARIFNSNWEALDNCDLPKNSLETQELSCIVQVSNLKEKDYYVCIESDNAQSNYQIESETSGEVCGNSGTDFSDYDRDYNIFAYALQFSPENITINSSTFLKATGEDFIDSLNTYVSEKYENNCTLGCTMPFKVISNTNQEFILSEALVKFLSGSTTLTNNKIYSVSESKNKIDSSPIRIDVEKAALKIPIKQKDTDLQLYINDQAILTKKIAIEVTPGFDFDIEPRNVQFGIETTLIAKASTNIIKTRWDFGDGIFTDSTGNTIKHIFLEEGIFNITVEATDSKNAITKKDFQIEVANASESLKDLLNDTKTKINSLSISINNFESWIREEIFNIENITLYLYEVNEIENILEQGNESEYSTYAERLYTLNIPRNISYGATQSLPFEIGYANIDSQYVIDKYSSECGEECSEYNLLDENEINDFIIAWYVDHFSAKTEYKEIVRTNTQREFLIGQYKMTFNKESDYSDEVNLIIPLPIDSVSFKEDYGQTEIEGDFGGISIPIDQDKTIEFLVDSNIDIQELGAYLSPDIEYIMKQANIKPSCENNPNDPACQNPRTKIGVWMIALVVLIFFITYLILQEWYKRRYESYLFPNKDDLYNVINYINNSRKAKINDNVTNKKLLEMKWKGEQITYAFRKLDGKRTGMFEIPIFKFLENRKVKKEIDKRTSEESQNPATNRNVRFFNGAKQ